jgi:Tfp pilus assembly protein PilF
MTAMTARVRLGQAYLQAGQLERARPLLEYALCYLTPEESPRFRALALDALGRLHQARDEPGQAGPLLAEARLLHDMLSQP